MLRPTQLRVWNRNSACFALKLVYIPYFSSLPADILVIRLLRDPKYNSNRDEIQLRCGQRYYPFAYEEYRGVVSNQRDEREIRKKTRARCLPTDLIFFLAQMHFVAHFMHSKRRELSEYTNCYCIFWQVFIVVSLQHSLDMVRKCVSYVRFSFVLYDK